MMTMIRNHMRMEAERALSRVAKVRIGIVDSYDPSHYACKVRIQPENYLTGWLPVTTAWVGNGWGMFCPPTPGDIVEVQFQEGDQESPFVVLRFFSNSVKPLPVPSGEFWLVHQSGSFLKFHNDGSVEIKAPNHLNITGDVYVTGAIFASGDITDQTGTTNESMKGMRNVFNGHHHVNVTHGSDLSGLPDIDM